MPTVLLVEDNELNRDMLGRRLTRKGYAVLTATDGQAGVDAAIAHRPDIILLDMGLPVMDGWTAVGVLKKDERTRAIPVIALTAHVMAGERERTLQAGCDEYDTKPVELARLLGKMAGLLGPKAPAAEGRDGTGNDGTNATA